MRMRWLVPTGVLAALAAGALAACFGGDFEPVSKIDTVRILASRADKPYAKPGDTVNVEVLAFDGRVDKTRPMKIFWIPIVCTNPIEDLYYACAPQILAKLAQLASARSAGDAGADAGPSFDGGLPPGFKLPTGIDISPFLPSGPTFSFKLDQDIIATHTPVPGAPQPYGLAIVFNIACAGHIELLPADPNDLRKQQIPIGCFDENHVQLGPTEWVLGFSRVYAYDTFTNANPEITSATFQGADAGSDQTVSVCTAQHRADCPEIKMGVTVPDTSWEPNPGDSSNNGKAHEQIWADYYVSVGDFKYDARLLFDTAAGRLVDVDNSLYAPDKPGDGTVFIVVHDNRGGASWTSFGLHVQ